MFLSFSAFFCFFIIRASFCENIKEIPVKYISLRTLDSSFQPTIDHGQFLIKKDIQRKPIIINGASKRILSVKTASIDEFYDTKEFQELLKEFNLTVDIKKLPNIKDVVSLLGTKNSLDTLVAIRDFASTNDGLDLIKNYLEYDMANDRVDDFSESRASKLYESNENIDENDSWWMKIINWLGLNQSTKFDSKKKDLEILTTIVPIKDSFHENVKSVGKFLKPAPITEIPINPPFKVFNSQSINLSNQPYSIDIKSLPTIRMTEQQYNEMMKSFNVNAVKLAKYDTNKLNKGFLVNQINSSGIKRNFLMNSQPVRSSFIPSTGSLYKANPYEIDKISKILSEKNDDKPISDVSEVTAQHF